MKFLRAILKSNKDRITNTNIRLELGVDEMNNGIQKIRLRLYWAYYADGRGEDT